MLPLPTVLRAVTRFALVLLAAGCLLASGGRAVRAGENEPPAVGSEQPVIASAIANGPQTVTITWTHSGNGVYYFVIEEKTTGKATTAGRDLRGMTISGPPLQASTPYTFDVCAVYASNRVCSDEKGVMTLPAQASTGSNHPLPPIITNNDAGFDRNGDPLIGLYWESDGTSYDYYEIRYEVKPASGTWQDPGTPTRAPDSGSSAYHQVGGLLPGTTYLFEIQGCGRVVFGILGSTCDDFSSAYQATTLFLPNDSGDQTPTVVDALTRSSDTEIDISWTIFPNHSSDHHYDHYIIQYQPQSAAGGTAVASMTAQVPGDQDSYSATNLTPGTTYVFTVQGCDLILMPTPGVDCATPSAPYSATAVSPAPLVTGGGTLVPALLSLSQPTVTAGNSVTVSGQAFPANAGTVTLTLTSAGVPIVTLGTARASGGAFSTTVTIPANTGAGSYMVHAQATGAQADASLQLTAPGGKGTLTITDPTSGLTYTGVNFDYAFTLNGTNFTRGTVTIFLDSPTGPQLGTATVAADGTFKQDLTIATGQTSSGKHTLVAVQNGTVQATLPMIVETLEGVH